MILFLYTGDTIGFSTGGDEDFRMAGGGTFHAEGDIIAFSSTISSDRRLKENIEPLEYGLDDLLKIIPVSFDWRLDNRGYDIGLIAQEILEIIPEIVETHPTIGYTKKYLETNYPTETTDRYTVDYAKLSVIIINAIKELKKEIEELKNGSSK